MIKKHLIVFVLLGLWFSPALAADELIRGDQRQLLKRMSPVASEERLLRFQKKDGSILRLHNSFFVVLKPDANLNALLQTYPVKLVKAYAKQTFLLSTDQPILPTINVLYQDKDTLDAYPNTYKKVMMR